VLDRASRAGVSRNTAIQTRRTPSRTDEFIKKLEEVAKAKEEETLTV
jgi:hypothetical protein